MFKIVVPLNILVETMITVFSGSFDEYKNI